MSTRNTTILNRTDLKYLLLDSLKRYTDDLIYISGNNPYKFKVNQSITTIFLRNVHESGNNRLNEDECSMQISSTAGLKESLNNDDVTIFLGYFEDENVFTAWNPFVQSERLSNDPEFMNRVKGKNIRVYSRFSVQSIANTIGISQYSDSDNQSVITFRPEYLGLYLDNVNNIHGLNENELLQLINYSDENVDAGSNNVVPIGRERMTITHTRYKRDPNFRKSVCTAYDFKCAMCGIQLELVEAAHIVPHSHDLGSDDVNNGISLCSLHHKAYDRSLIYFTTGFKIMMNKRKVSYLRKTGLDFELEKFSRLAYSKIKLPSDNSLRPNSINIITANKVRGI